jgi:hypothetical protein
MAKAQKEPGLLQRDLLAGRLAGSDFPSRAWEIPSLVQTDLPASKLVGADPDPPKAARPNSEVLCDIAKCQLCEIAKTRLGNIPTFLPEARLCNTADTSLGNRDSPMAYFDLPEAELCDTARATRRVNALSPLVDSKGQRVLRSFAGDFTARKQDAVGLRTPVATIQVLCTSPRAEDSEAGHLLELVRLQALTRREAKGAT